MTQQHLLVRIQVMAPVWSDHFPGRWENVSDDGIRLAMPQPVAPGSVIAVHTRSLMMSARVRRCHDLRREGYAVEASVIGVYPHRETLRVSRETAGLVRLWVALEKLRSEETEPVGRRSGARPRGESMRRRTNRFAQPH